MTDLSQALDAAENGNWHGSHALQWEFAKAAGGEPIPMERQIPVIELERAIAWGNRQVSNLKGVIQ